MLARVRLQPIDLRAWIDEHRELLRPPVGNKRIWADSETIVMIVGGPNTRTDYHIDPGEELFYQIEGDIELGVVEGGEHRTIVIREGELLLLPSNVPHSPRRGPNTVGLVVERKRLAGERDGLRWYCDACRAIVHEVFFELEDIETQLAEAIERWQADTAMRTCPNCGRVAAARRG